MTGGSPNLGPGNSSLLPMPLVEFSGNLRRKAPEGSEGGRTPKAAGSADAVVVREASWTASHLPLSCAGKAGRAKPQLLSNTFTEYLPMSNKCRFRRPNLAAKNCGNEKTGLMPGLFASTKLDRARDYCLNR